MMAVTNTLWFVSQSSAF